MNQKSLHHIHSNLQSDISSEDTYAILFPYQFLLLCKLLGTTPQELITDFVNTLSCNSSRQEQQGKASNLLTSYFIAQGYGQDLYSPEDICDIFLDMEAISQFYPNSNIPQTERQKRWCNIYHAYWYDKWVKNG